MNLFSFQQKGQLTGNLTKQDRYRLLGIIGNGRYSDVYTAFDTLLNRIVAIKQFRKEYLSDEKLVKAFLKETILISYLDHPGVVSIYDSFLNEDGTPCYSMNLIKGETLRSEMRSKSKNQLLAIFTKLCETLAYVHDKGVVHLDINPENILIGQYGEVLLTDWGNSRLYDTGPYKEYLKLVRDAPPPPGDDQLVQCKISPYSSPELLENNPETLSPSSDIFSMGIMLYEMMIGSTPYSSNDNVILSSLIQSGQIQPIHELNSDLPKMVSEICATMTNIDPFNRYHSFHTTLHDLDTLHNSGQAFMQKQFDSGELIFREGDAGAYAFIILSGKVEISRNVDGKKRIIAHLGKNEIVGELAIFSHDPRSATVQALEPTIVRIMDKESVDQELQKLSPWVQNMVSCLSKRFVQLNDFLIK